MRTAAFRRTAIVIASVLMVLATGPGASASASAPTTEPVIELGTFRHDFSPNGDGYHDRLVIPVRLHRTATVSLRVVDLDTKKVLLDNWTLCLAGGTSSCVDKPGRYTVTWDDVTALYPLRNYDHRAGRYAVALRANRHVGSPYPGPSARAEVRLLDSVALRPASGQRTFSPNADGRVDRLSLPFDLERRSRVRLAVRDEKGSVVLRADLGRLAAGRQTWSWRGYGADRRKMTDGRYRIRLAATPVARPGHTGAAATDVRVDTRVAAPPVGLSRPTVYPRATVFADSIRVGVGPYGYDEDQTTLASAIRTTAGKLVRKLPLLDVPCYIGPESDGRCHVTDWNGRNTGGSVVPAGSYLLRVVREDAAGNREVVTRTVTVSDRQLVEHAGSVTWAAGDTPSWSPFCMGNHCGEAPYSIYGYSWAPATGVSPHDRYRLTVTGTPPAPGGTGTTTLLYGTYGPTPGTVPLQGDQPITTPWTSVAPDVEALGGDDRRAMWSISRAGSTTPGDYYQVATFTLDYTYFAPAS